jgi:hypothetical protein
MWLRRFIKKLIKPEMEAYLRRMYLNIWMSLDRANGNIVYKLDSLFDNSHSVSNTDLIRMVYEKYDL